jgi:hypothetical protein
VAWIGFRALHGAPILIVVIALSDFSIAVSSSSDGFDV